MDAKCEDMGKRIYCGERSEREDLKAGSEVGRVGDLDIGVAGKLDEEIEFVCVEDGV